MPKIGPITHLFSSDLERAYKTAQAIMDAQMLPAASSSTAALEIVPLAELREKDFGSREGTRGRADEPPPAQPHDKPFVEPETVEAMKIRITRFLEAMLAPSLDEALHSNKAQSIVVVAHGAIHTHIWRQFMSRFKSETADTTLASQSSNASLQGIPLDAFLANTGYHEVIVSRRPPSSTKSAQHAYSFSIAVSSINSRDHLSGLKKTKGGIGSAKFDKKQKTIQSFLGPAAKRQKPESSKSNFTPTEPDEDEILAMVATQFD